MEEKFKDKKYTHFDFRKRSCDFEELVKNPEWVGQHGFYPFVHYELDKGKYSRKQGFIPKHRDIYYASHIDGYIFQHYGYLLNNNYNDYAKRLDIDENAIAYRNCWGAKNNVNFAREVFEYICNAEAACVYVTDLSNFFDTLDHSYLKRQIKKVLGTNELDLGNYAVFKNLTKFAYVDRKDLEDIATEKGTELERMDRFFNVKEFRERKKDLIKYNKENYGIPQGTSVSAVYANIYMTDFDKRIKDFVADRNGIYRRYCDDIIIVIPMKRAELESGLKPILDYVEESQNEVPNLKTNKDKTEQFFYENHSFIDIKDIGNENAKRMNLSYLGFDFDGINVRIRDKSIFKFYYRAYRKIERVNQWRYIDIHKYIAGKKAVYNGYTHLYSKSRAKNGKQMHGNFYTYAKRAHEEFSKSKSINSQIKRQLRRHWQKIEKRLNKSGL